MTNKDRKAGIRGILSGVGLFTFVALMVCIFGGENAAAIILLPLLVGALGWCFWRLGITIWGENDYYY